MALTLAQIIAAVGPSVMRTMRKPYVIGLVTPTPFDGGEYAVLMDPASRLSVPMVWNKTDEDHNTSEARIRLVHRLLENAINSLDDLTARQEPESDFEEVVFE